MLGAADALETLRPALLVVLGDRYEVLATAAAALLLRIPVAHIGGGDTSYGAVDESIRHAVTKLSHIHFVAAPAFRRRVLQLGEHPDRVHVVGSLALDAIASLDLLDRSAAGRAVGMDLGRPTLLVTYHPATLETEPPAGTATALTEALDAVPGATVIVTGSNADAGGRQVTAVFRKYAQERPRVRMVDSLGQLRYLSVLRHADVVVGNSSSGLIEAPALGTPTVNVGSRQDGRLKGPSVIDCENRAQDIAEAISRALSRRARKAAISSPYGDGHAARRIAEVLATTDLTGILVKKFVTLADQVQ